MGLPTAMTGRGFWGAEPPLETFSYGRCEISIANFKDPLLIDLTMCMVKLVKVRPLPRLLKLRCSRPWRTMIFSKISKFTKNVSKIYIQFSKLPKLYSNIIDTI